MKILLFLFLFVSGLLATSCSAVFRAVKDRGQAGVSGGDEAIEASPESENQEGTKGGGVEDCKSYWIPLPTPHDEMKDEEGGGDDYEDDWGDEDMGKGGKGETPNQNPGQNDGDYPSQNDEGGKGEMPSQNDGGKGGDEPLPAGNDGDGADGDQPDMPPPAKC